MSKIIEANKKHSKRLMCFVLACVYVENKSNPQIPYPIPISDFCQIVLSLTESEKDFPDGADVVKSMHNIPGTHSPRDYHITALDKGGYAMSENEYALVHWISRDYQNNPTIQKSLEGKDDYSWSQEVKKKAVGR